MFSKLKWLFVKDNSRQMFDDIVKAIVHMYSPVKIYVYGSYAQRTQNKESDVDICVLMPEGSRIARYDRLLDKSLSCVVGKKVHCVYCTEINGWCDTEIYPKFELK